MSIIQAFPENKSKAFSMTLWSIWKKRNKMYWEGIRETTHQVISRRSELLRFWERARISTQKLLTSSLVQVRWQPPHRNFLKCNVDAALFANEKRVGFGACVSDYRGQFYMAKAGICTSDLCLAEAEAWGLREAIKWMASTRYNHVLFETDCKQLVEE
ncbi:unnamed protein product [Cuscuta epithymum]|uniref:RNase H type-1 domain-containing protein n=1 Tax=Cuscuta epithymum TaxID=186058 RepID=A0AAV0EBH5_9ASTE|nr:unnamed protein product [Cuscuta epithymum]